MKLRVALPDDADELSSVALRAKASWGYPPAWIAEWEDALRFTPGYLQAHAVFVAEVDGEIVGVVSLEATPEPEIAHLWVLPDNHGEGVGSALMERAVRFARSEGWTSLRIESDPNAKAFYEKMGAAQIGRVAAPVAGHERFLPVLRLALV